MIFVVNAENHRRFQADLVEMCSQRKTAFVDRAGWEIPVIGDIGPPSRQRGSRDPRQAGTARDSSP